MECIHPEESQIGAVSGGWSHATEVGHRYISCRSSNAMQHINIHTSIARLYDTKG